MSEIEKIQRYIERTKMDKRLTTPYSINLEESFELAKQALSCGDFPIEAISLAFNYGRAKGYRAAKAEARRA